MDKETHKKAGELIFLIDILERAVGKLHALRERQNPEHYDVADYTIKGDILSLAGIMQSLGKDGSIGRLYGVVIDEKYVMGIVDDFIRGAQEALENCKSEFEAM